MKGRPRKVTGDCLCDYDAARDAPETRLFEPTPGSFVLLFPRTPNEKADP